MNNYPNDPTTRAGNPYPNTGQMPPPPQYPQPGYPPQYPGQPQFTPQMPLQQPVQPPKKKGKALWIILGLVVAVIACGVIANAGKSGTSTAPSSPSNPSNSNSNSTQQQAPPSKPQSWQTTHTYTGNGDKQTETITVGNDWKIKWSCEADDAPLFVEIYNADTNEMTEWDAVSTTCKNTPTTGETAEHGGGNLYLKIISGIDWTITIQELK